VPVEAPAHRLLNAAAGRLEQRGLSAISENRGR